MIAELASLREENHALKNELRDAREEITRLTGGGGGGVGGAKAEGGGGGGRVVAASGAATGMSESRAGGVRGDGADDDSGGGEGRRRSKKERGGKTTPRESRSRKKIDIDKARATDAVVETVSSGGQVNQGKVGPGSEEPGGGLDSRTTPHSERPPEAGL